MLTRRLALLVMTAALAGAASGQTPAPVLPSAAGYRPTSVYAHDFRARKGGTTEFDKETPKIGVEFFRDDASAAVLALTQAGELAVTPLTAVGAEKKAPWLYAHDLGSRKGDEERFTKETAKFGVEAFRDTATGKLLYVSEKATIAFADLPESVGTGKPPAWHHALIVKVRGAKEKEFTPATRKFGVEVFKDGNTGGLIYVSETGSVAAAPAPAKTPSPDGVKAPRALYGLALPCRKAAEAGFGDATKALSVEVFRDENTGGLLYVSETGSIATAPPADAKTGQGVPRKYAVTLRARPGGVADFAKATPYGVEVYFDANTGNTVYACETGSIAVLPKK